MSEENPAHKDDSFLDIFRKNAAVMLLIEPETGQVLDANPAAEKFYGYTRVQLQAMNMFEINPLPRDQVTAEWDRLSNGELDYVVFPHRLASGEIRTIEAHSTPITINGRLVNFSIIHDVSGRKQAEDALTSAAGELRSLLASMRDVVLVIDRQGIYREIAPTNPDLLYKPSNELLGMNIADIFPLEQTEAYINVMCQVLETGQPSEIEYSLVIGARTLWFEATISALTEDRTLWVARNTTERKQMDIALRESEERYRSLFENMIDGIYRSTPQGKFVDINPAMVKMFGYASKEEMLNIDIKKELYFSPAERGSHILDTGQQEIETYRMRRKDGSEIWVEDHGNYVHDEQGNILYHEGMLRDITERKRAEEIIRENETLLRESQIIAGLGSYVLDFATGLWMSSEVLDRIFGIDESYIRSVEGWSDLIHPDERKLMIDYFANEVVGRRGRFDKEYRIIRKSDHVERWVHGMGALEIDDQGAVRKLRGSIQDITERKLSEEILRQRLMELEALHNVSASLRKVQTFAEALPVLLDQTLAALGTETGTILLYHPQSGELRDTTPRGWFEEFKDIPVKVGEGVAGTVFVTGQPYVSVEFARDSLPSGVGRSMIPPGWGGACVPIWSDAEIVGVIFASVQLPQRIAPEQLKLLNSLAEIAGATLHRTRLFDETARRAQEFASLYETSNALSAETELHTMLRVIVANAKKLLNASSSGMYFFIPATNEVELTMDTNPDIPLGIRLSMGEGVAGRVAQTRKPLRIDDYSSWEGRSLKYQMLPIRAVLEVPMLYRGELIGVLTADEVGDSERKFTEADERLLSLFASQAAGAIHSARLRDEAIHRLQRLQTLRTVDKAITSSLDLHITLDILLSHVLTQLEVDAADVLLLDTHEQSLKFSAGNGYRTQMIEGANVHMDDSYAGRSVTEHRIVQVSDPSQIIDNPSFAQLWSEEDFKSYVCVPLISKGEVKGVLEVYCRSKFSPSNEWLDFLETLAGQAAITIDNTQMFENVQQVNMELAVAYEATIEGWSRALDLRDKETEGHTQRVTELTMLLAKAMGINDNELQHIRRGALLHDIGKMGISDHILLKKGKLTAKEWKIMHTHPNLAFQMLEPIAYLRQALDIPYSHHEKWDGTGYPRGLKGEEIPFVARIFAIADVWDAVTSSRPYREAWTKKKALAYIKEQSGKHFDPHIVEVFLQVIKNSQLNS